MHTSSLSRQVISSPIQRTGILFITPFFTAMPFDEEILGILAYPIILRLTLTTYRIDRKINENSFIGDASGENMFGHNFFLVYCIFLSFNSKRFSCSHCKTRGCGGRKGWEKDLVLRKPASLVLFQCFSTASGTPKPGVLTTLSGIFEADNNSPKSEW